jgi:alkylation response protein AidB-like acyl-CoA dehydrogenase
VGEIDGGWKLARTTLRNESSMISGAGQATTFVAVRATAERCGRLGDPLVRQELARVWTHEQLLRYLQLRAQTAVVTGRREVAVHGSLMKNMFTRALSHRVQLAVDLLGAEGMLWDDAEGDGFWQYQCLNQFASRIGGGTEEVHRNNLAEQALGLPREMRTDLDVPWKDVVKG